MPVHPTGDRPILGDEGGIVNTIIFALRQVNIEV